MPIYSKNIYEIAENQLKRSILIIYNISDNHYVGLPIHNNDIKDSIHIPSINKYIVTKELAEYSRKNIKRIGICERKLSKN